MFVDWFYCLMLPVFDHTYATNGYKNIPCLVALSWQTGYASCSQYPFFSNPVPPS